MNILVTGLGSMGKRRVRILCNNLGIRSVAGADPNEERRNFIEKEHKIKTFSSIDDAEFAGSYDCAFVCAPPLSHSSIIERCLDKSMNVFSEINLTSDGYKSLINKAKENDCKLFLSSTPMYRKEIQYITQRVRDYGDNLNYIYHVGQYLPDWHPWESYKDFFVGDKRTNGCRELFAIELPWIINAFGAIEGVFSAKSKNTGLDIEYPDNYIVTMTHASGHRGVLCVDVVTRKPARKLEVYGENLHISWNGTPESLINYDIENARDEEISTYESVSKNNNYSDNIIENMYIDETVNFLNYVRDEAEPLYSFEKDYQTLKIIDEIEK
jgi:predicted dehydrogenase